ncbi:SCO family protein [Macrococcus armenti]|uniref:SCO family protein n=1 Tax=Macrococcus armenti TaxID=2875764 RepID=A0ABY3ZVB4_9STAP|nr:SCO family protein [Macrococcus armenti]UBH13392.1 SCO family protein [Macrococcus armenti]UOB20773.1 SCO family protein [Macrococcus armenti]
MRTERILSALLIIIGLIFLGIATDGYKAFTLEQKRVTTLETTTPKYPNIEVVDNKGRTYPFDTFKGKYILMTFIYTNCSTVCPMMEQNMKSVYKNIDMKKYKDDIVFVSLSFDRERDTVKVLDRYAGYFDADGETWRMVTPTSDKDLKKILDTYGVIVIPDGDNNFQHNTSFYLIKPDGKLHSVMKFQDIDSTTETVQQALKDVR